MFDIIVTSLVETQFAVSVGSLSLLEVVHMHYGYIRRGVNQYALSLITQCVNTN